ncbi:MAG: hypothetical protein HYZ34_12850 [Ignavibacteriae bacterium]|nr:hypothetical protein [Ignavibacteriota bacterium]
MPEKNYRIILDEENSLFVYYETIGGQVTAFVVKLLSIIDDEEVEILRYDSGHGVPHIDILNADGEVERKIWLHHLTHAQAFTEAQETITTHYQFYRERFIQWKNEKKKNN